MCVSVYAIFSSFLEIFNGKRKKKGTTPLGFSPFVAYIRFDSKDYDQTKVFFSFQCELWTSSEEMLATYRTLISSSRVMSVWLSFSSSHFFLLFSP